jgi:hypothetical protein
MPFEFWLITLETHASQTKPKSLINDLLTLWSSLYVAQTLTWKNNPHFAHQVEFIWFSELVPIISLNNFSLVTFVIEVHHVFCELGRYWHVIFVGNKFQI